MRAFYLFRFDGRLTRGGFFVRVVLVLAAFALLDAGLQPFVGAWRTWLLNPVALWVLLAAGAQRLHDRDHSARWLLLGVIPILGALWLLWQFLRAGVRSDNRWGPDPARENRDFLVVR